MNRIQFANLVRNSHCRVVGAENASNDPQRSVLAALIAGCKEAESVILCEPSLARKTNRPPDGVLVCLSAGVHVVEVKGITLDQVVALEPGGQFRIRYNGMEIGKNPFAQVRNAMFDIKDAVVRQCSSDLVLPFKYWVILATISRKEWMDKWGAECLCPPELLFSDDLPTLYERLRGIGTGVLKNEGLKCWPTDQIQSVWRAFGDTSVLFPRPEERQPRRVREGTLGELFDEAAEVYKALSDEQQRLSAQTWDKGPRLVRGVAGSGKTIVLANNLARRVQRSLTAERSLFTESRQQRIAAVCFNRALVPFIRKKIDLAFRQRTGNSIPDAAVEVWSYNKLMWNLSQRGLWRYQKLEDADNETLAGQYLKELIAVKEYDPSAFERCCFDAIYVDEGQDFSEADFRLLKELCRTEAGGEPSLFIFYDDAQNLHARQRPNWTSLGLNIVGRSHIMTECFRNTQPIIEATFNVLYGSFADGKQQVPTKEFGDIRTLEEKRLLQLEDGVWRVKFAKRNGLTPKVTVLESRQRQWAEIVERLRWLTEDQQVRPEDIHVLVCYKNQIEKLVAAIEAAQLSAVHGIHIPTIVKDELLHKRGCLSVSTVASAKGYDAYCVLIANGDEFPSDIQGRVNFYVASTRAIEYLEVFASSRRGLVAEMEQAVAALKV